LIAVGVQLLEISRNYLTREYLKSENIDFNETLQTYSTIANINNS